MPPLSIVHSELLLNKKVTLLKITAKNIVYPEFIFNEKFVCTHLWQGRSIQGMIMFVFQGCYDLVTSFMETNMGIIAGVAFGIAFSQVTA